LQRKPPRPVFAAKKARASRTSAVKLGQDNANDSAGKPCAAARSEAVADAQQSLKDLRRGLIDKGLTNNAEIDEAIAAWETWGRNPDAMYLRCRCECVARKCS